MKRIMRGLCLALSVFMLAGLCGCGKKKAAMPTLKIVYLAGNVTSTYDIPGRENAITTRGIFGDSTKTYSWDEPLEPAAIEASDKDGSVQLAFSYGASDLSVYVSDTATGETQTSTGTTIELEGGRDYSISAAGSWAAGNYIYQMEFAFDLISPVEDEPVLEEAPAESPEPEPETLPEPEIPDEVGEVEAPELPEEEEEDKLFYNPPALIVSYNGETMKPAMGTTTWSCEKNGIMNEYSADSDHPMEWKNLRTVQRVYGEDTVQLSFEYEPDEYTITIWNDDLVNTDVEDRESFYAMLEQQAEEIILEDGAFELGVGYNTGYVVMVEARWLHGQQGDTGYWGGRTIYAFGISPTNY